MGEEDTGHRTYRDLIHHRVQFAQLSRTASILLGLLSYGVDLPFFGRFFRYSFTLVCLALSRFRRKGDYTRLYALLLQVLMLPDLRKIRTYRWWYLMRFGVAITQERQINWMLRDILLEDNLILLGSLGPRPLKGYDIAYSFVGYALWLFERGDVLGALNMIKIAEDADETWGYPEYLHGWFGLFTKGVDSVEHFARAVQIDWSFLQRMKQDRTCRQHPEVLHEVQKRILVSK